jgi:hypothetical protein
MCLDSQTVTSVISNDGSIVYINDACQIKKATGTCYLAILNISICHSWLEPVIKRGDSYKKEPRQKNVPKIVILIRELDELTSLEEFCMCC